MCLKTNILHTGGLEKAVLLFSTLIGPQQGLQKFWLQKQSVPGIQKLWVQIL